jgi:hypothetical protein
MGNREIVSLLGDKAHPFEENGAEAAVLLEPGRDTAIAEDAPPALIESPTAIRGSGIPMPPRKIVATARTTILRWAVARVRNGRLVRQSTHVRQTPITHHATKRRTREREQEGSAVASAVAV